MVRQNLNTWRDNIPDWVWPHLTGKPEPPPKEETSIAVTNEALLGEIEDNLEQRIYQGDERHRNVEAKLMALLTLTSVLSAAVTTGLAVALTVHIPSDFPTVLVWGIVALVPYIAMNLLWSLWATVSGLIRRGYKQLTYEDMIPKTGEDLISYRNRIISLRLNHAKWNDWVLDNKVSEMAVAHAALRNALAATGVVIIIALAIIVFRLL